jgi:hypothetical protein
MNASIVGLQTILVLTMVVTTSVNFFLASQKDQNIPRWFTQMNLHDSNNGRIQIVTFWFFGIQFPPFLGHTGGLLHRGALLGPIVILDNFDRLCHPDFLVCPRKKAGSNLTANMLSLGLWVGYCSTGKTRLPSASILVGLQTILVPTKQGHNNLPPSSPSSPHQFHCSSAVFLISHWFCAYIIHCKHGLIAILSPPAFSKLFPGTLD